VFAFIFVVVNTSRSTAAHFCSSAAAVSAYSDSVASEDPSPSIDIFLDRWSNAAASERANAQLFLTELADLLGVPRPGNDHAAGYSFEFPVRISTGTEAWSEGRIDLYRRGCFVLEAKQFIPPKAEQTTLELAAEKMGAVARSKKTAAPVRDTDRWDDAMLKAFVQARDYVRALPVSEPAPPFLLVVDVGHAIEVRSDFSLTGRAYQPFPDPLTYRIRLEHLRDEKARERLKLIWTNPGALDPSKRSAEVTREVAKHLAELAKSFEKKHSPKIVAEFLTRCLFCMFAEDVGLLPNADGKKGFTELLNTIPTNGEGFETMLRTLFAEMNEGRSKEISVILRRKLLKFNGGLFADNTVLPVNGTQLGILKAAAALDWQHVEPAIFGTLLERALGGEGERHKLGAHFTPRSYVERLVLPTVIEPLRAEWENVRAAAYTLEKRSSARSAKAKELMAETQKKQDQGDYAAAKVDYKLVQEEEKSAAADLEKARSEINSFHERLCNVKVLDPACGSGNFLYVALEHLKRLEGEVLIAAADFGENFKLGLEKHTVDPHQFLGLEINPRAASIAEMVLWIGYLQWHFRTRGQTMPAEPVLKNFKNIQCRDAVLAYDGEPQPVLDAAGNAKSVWNRLGKKTDTVTGREVPDETKRVPLLTYTNPRPATWPEADFIVGNPPFMGARTIRPALDDGYLDALRGVYPNIPENADFVMYWWHKAAELVRAGKVKRFGLITTNSLRQSFNRQVTETQLAAQPPLSLAFAIPDHPWVDTADGAAVRIAMTVGVPGAKQGELLEVKDEQPQDEGAAKVSFLESRGKILPDIRIGAEITTTKPLKSNEPFCCVGYQLTGTGFVLKSEEKDELAKKDKIPRGQIFHPLLSARDITQETRDLWAIDLFGHTIESVRQNYPATFQQVLTRVKPERDSNARASVRDRWWIYGEARSTFRPALADLKRAIVAPLTSKHRLFIFCDAKTVADSTTVLFAFDDAFHLGILSSRIHVKFSLAAGGRLGVGNDPRYNKSDCFDPFPFPLCGEREKTRIRELAEALDAHRKQVQAKHGVTLTGLYNVLEKIRAGETLTEKEKFVHDRGLVSTLKSLHDDLDVEVFCAYGWNDLAHACLRMGEALDLKTGLNILLSSNPETRRNEIAAQQQLLDAEILERLVKLNATRAEEEARGVVHWLRPEYQKPRATASQSALALTDAPAKKKSKANSGRQTQLIQNSKFKIAWPKPLAERIRTVETALHAAAKPTAAADLAKYFVRARPADISEILETLVMMGRARRNGDLYNA
jgi:hypothetical protein